MTTWTPVSTSSASWVALSGGEDDWVDPRLTLLLTESGLSLLTENERFLAIEAVSNPASSWVPL